MTAVGTFSLPVTWMVSTRLDRRVTDSRAAASPAKKVYRVRNRPRK